jgi:hypothetical protein
VTVVVVIFLPLVLAYQAWTYYVFRRRISKDEFQLPPQPGTRLTHAARYHDLMPLHRQPAPGLDSTNNPHISTEALICQQINVTRS